MNVYEFYSRLGVNPYVYIAVFAAVGIGIFLFGVMINFMISKSIYRRKTHTSKESEVSVRATITQIDLTGRRKGTVTFADTDDEKHIFVVSKTDAIFLSVGEEGELRFRGDKYLGFGELSEDADADTDAECEE